MAIARRTRFVAPFIVTVTACGSSKEQGPGNPPEPRYAGASWTVRMRDMKCMASVVVSDPRENPPAPTEIECPPGMSGNNVITVGALSESECGVVPRGCTDKQCITMKTPCPLPPGKHVVRKLANVWTIEKRGAGCHAEEGDCPPGVDCNPPEPRMVPCPEGITEDKNVRIAELPDATCVIVPDGCEDTSCVGAKTRCPTQ